MVTRREEPKQVGYAHVWRHNALECDIYPALIEIWHYMYHQLCIDLI